MNADCRVKGRVNLLFQFSHLGQLIVIASPAACMGDSYRRDNSHSEQGHKTCVLLLECRFHVHLSFETPGRILSRMPKKHKDGKVKIG